MKPSWMHWDALKGKCPICGAPAHVGQSIRTLKLYWLHDQYPGMDEFYETHGIWELDEIPRDEFKRLREEAKARGEHPEPVIRQGGRRKQVRCVETGTIYKSIQDAADAVGVARPSLSTAIKRGGRSGGYHWELLDG